MSEIFENLESNDKRAVEEAKKKLHDTFQSVRESWLLNGLYEYYLNTNSARSLEVLINVNEPHYTYLFERLSDSLVSSNTETKVKALTLLGHVITREPTWIYRIYDHPLLKTLLNLLKSEGEILPLISALLSLIVLMPMIPSLMGKYLNDVFVIFSRLASWNSSGKIIEEQMVHLQMALYFLFQRLYGMYPCNFLAYLRIEYKDKEKNRAVFEHTIRPLLNSVKMHPSLVTASKDNETTSDRWKSMGVQDVIVECERFSLDNSDKCSHESCHLTPGFRSRSGTTNSTIIEPTRINIIPSTDPVKTLAIMPNTEGRDFFSPSMFFPTTTPPIPEATNVIRPTSSIFMSQEGTSPPEAAIEATPETTPIRDLHTNALRGPHPHLNSTVVRALSLGAKSRSIGSGNTTPIHSQPSSPMRKDLSFNFTTSEIRVSKKDQKVRKLLQDRTQLELNYQHPSNDFKPVHPMTLSSPVKILQQENNHRHSPLQRTDSPVSQEDEEVLSIVGKDDIANKNSSQCDIVLYENNEDTNNAVKKDVEKGSPCTAGGLHMPNSKSMNDFAKRVQRYRYYSQCNTETDHMEISTGSSPGTQLPNNAVVRRANSCPDMKKSPVPVPKDVSKPLKETDEDGEENITNGVSEVTKIVCTMATQTENFFPYEHLFCYISPSFDSSEIKPSPAPSPAPFNYYQEKELSAYDILDRYIETSVRNDAANLRIQLELVYDHLLFERYRRKTHALRNRSLLADAKRTRRVDELNSALRDQVQLQQKHIDTLTAQLDSLRKEKLNDEKRAEITIQTLKDEFKILQLEVLDLKEHRIILDNEVKGLKTKCTSIDSQRQLAEANLLDAKAEVNIAREQASAGERGRAELEQLNKEILMIGELHQKYQERLQDLSVMKQCEQEIVHLKDGYKREITVLQQQVDVKGSNIDACRCRIVELEHTILQKDDIISAQKKMLMGVNKEYNEKLKAVESKYQTQVIINRSFEERLLELLQRNEIISKRGVHSPDTSSCHEAAATDRTAPGLSPHSSPLSASLASSEGSVAFGQPDCKNLQILVDRKKTKAAEDLEQSEKDVREDNSQLEG